MGAANWRADDEIAEALGKLEVLWLRYAPALNLTGAKDRETLGLHIDEGKATARLGCRICGDGDWVDIGAGGGFPGLVLAACVDRAIWLVEPRHKRCAFLEMCLGALGRGDCRVVQARYEDAELPHFGLASARAVFEPAQWLRVGGSLADAVVVHAEEEDAPAGWVDRDMGGGWAVLGYQSVPRETSE